MNKEEREYIEAVEKWRKEKDDFFKRHPQSPLTPEQKKEFTGLKYYPPDPKYRFVVKLNKFENPEIVHIITNTPQVQDYFRYAYVEFEVEGKKCRLHVYKSPGDEYLFVPFLDATSGNETYESGRYVELQHIQDDLYLLDFNFAYNPYCAYNNNWVCPITPQENRLNCPIKAGEKIFKEKTQKLGFDLKI